MRLEQHGEGWHIIEDFNEIFFRYVKDEDGNIVPRLIPELIDWWEETAPGRWRPSHIQGNIRSIRIDDPSLFNLFKLAWHEDARVRFLNKGAAAFVYAAHIPLTVTNTGSLPNFTKPAVSFESRYDLKS